MDDQRLESLKSDIRSVLLTEKNGVSISRLDREFMDVMGCRIEYDRRQYGSLEAFLLTLPDTVRITKYDGDVICQAVCSEKQEGIQRLVRQQKTDTKKRTVVRRPLQSQNYSRPVSSRPVFAKRFNSSTSYGGGGSNDGYQRRRTGQSNENAPSNGYSRRSTDTYGNQSSANTTNGYKRRSLDTYGNQSSSNTNGYTRRSVAANISYTPAGDKEQGNVFDVRAQNGQVNVKVFVPGEEEKKKKEEKERKERQEREQQEEQKQKERQQCQPGSNANGSNWPDENESTNRQGNRTARSNGPYKKWYNDGNKPAPRAPKLQFEIRDDEPTDYKYELSSYTQEHGLPEPRYVSSSHVEKGRVISYFSKVEIGSRSWLIFPVSYRTPEGADSGVAKKALDDLRKQNSPADNRKDSDAPTSNTDDTLRKLAELINDQSLFSNAIEDEFLAKFGYKLASNWFDLVENSKIFDVQKIQAGKKLLITVALSKAYLSGEITLDVSEPDSGNDSIEPKTDDTTNDQDESELSDLAGQMSGSTLEERSPDSEEESATSYIQNLPGELELNSEADWEIMVLNINNRKELFVRLVDNTDKLDELIADMQKFYEEDQLGTPVKHLIIKRIYAAVLEGAVFRVQAILLDDDKVTCYFLDDGVYEKVDRSSLRELDDRFMKLPFQAFMLQLEGVENKSDSLFRKFFDEKMPESGDSLTLIARPTSYDPIIVRLYDTSGEEDLDLNLELIDYISTSEKELPGALQSVRPSELPAILKEEDGQRVAVSMAINPNNFMISSVILQDEYQRMDEELQQIYSDETIPLSADLIYPGLYVSARRDVKQEDRGHKEMWFRARIESKIASKEHPKFTATLIDLGEMIVLELHEIQPLYSQFSHLPMRVSRASLNGLMPVGKQYDIDAIFRFKQLIDQKQFTVHDCELVSVDSEHHVLLDLKDGEGRSISEELVKAKIARYCS